MRWLFIAIALLFSLDFILFYDILVVLDVVLLGLWWLSSSKNIAFMVSQWFEPLSANG